MKNQDENKTIIGLKYCLGRIISIPYKIDENKTIIGLKSNIKLVGMLAPR